MKPVKHGDTGYPELSTFAAQRREVMGLTAKGALLGSAMLLGCDPKKKPPADPPIKTAGELISIEPPKPQPASVDAGSPPADQGRAQRPPATDPNRPPVQRDPPRSLAGEHNPRVVDAGSPPADQGLDRRTQRRRAERARRILEPAHTPDNPRPFAGDVAAFESPRPLPAKPKAK